MPSSGFWVIFNLDINDFCIFVDDTSDKEFFESINPKSDFNNDGDALETYLYEKSLKVQPKEADRIPDVKPKRSLHVLKSPGIKPPKSNHYSTSHHHAGTSCSTQSSTAPSTPRADGEGSRPALLTPTEDGAHFSLIDITPGQHPKFFGDVPKRTYNIDNAPSAFVFPTIEAQNSPPPALPPRLTGLATSTTTSATMSNNEQLRVLPDRASSESSSPTVCLSVPLPPALPPRRGTAAQQTPPPLPPKMRTTGSPSLQRTSVSPLSPDTPPPLPPKTYKILVGIYEDSNSISCNKMMLEDSVPFVIGAEIMKS
uniref:SH3 domain-containing protein n=1 Tax=Angiostrongylus cantonensis TaxID=6313 RepID=A0A0K0DHV1_ANGCA